MVSSAQASRAASGPPTQTVLSFCRNYLARRGAFRRLMVEAGRCGASGAASQPAALFFDQLPTKPRQFIHYDLLLKLSPIGADLSFIGVWAEAGRATINSPFRLSSGTTRPSRAKLREWGTARSGRRDDPGPTRSLTKGSWTEPHTRVCPARDLDGFRGL
jgi:hypothetical protein